MNSAAQKPPLARASQRKEALISRWAQPGGSGLRLPVATALAACALVSTTSLALASGCEARSSATLAPVIELYTSEGCSSCPPADRWLSTLKEPAAKRGAVVQAFHVGYWDYIGWVDRFAAPSHTKRQNEVAHANRLSNIYTPQVVRDGQDWPGWRGGSTVFRSSEPARAEIELRRAASGLEGDRFDAQVTPAFGADTSWAAYWSVTEHGHRSKVGAGENAGESLKHDFVVRQYVPVGTYRGPARLSFSSIAADPAHPRQVNLVVFEPASGAPLAALSLNCAIG